ncbi:MAG: helix-turn-helix transcriptional regulator [Gemmataceae bacterium]
MEQPKLLTVDEVADELRIATRTVWRWAESGWLPAPLRLGRRVVRWRAEDIRRFLDLAGSERSP